MRAKVVRFEDLIAWQFAREFNKRLAVHRDSVRRISGARAWEQIHSASHSIASNIAEGFERRSLGDFHRFLCYSKDSAAEVRSGLHLLLDEKSIPAKDFEHLLHSIEELARVIEGLRRSVAAQRKEPSVVKEDRTSYAVEWILNR